MHPYPVLQHRWFPIILRSDEEETSGGALARVGVWAQVSQISVRVQRRAAHSVISLQVLGTAWCTESTGVSCWVGGCVFTCAASVPTQQGFTCDGYE